jgi:hypothetical protein
VGIRGQATAGEKRNKKMISEESQRQFIRATIKKGIELERQRILGTFRELAESLVKPDPRLNDFTKGVCDEVSIAILQICELLDTKD